jgi:uncharacterized protein (TIGR04255 family)
MSVRQEQPYKRPPITEAVIELRFATALDARDLEKASSSLASIYPDQQSIQNLVGVQLGLESGLDNQALPQMLINQQNGYRRLSTDSSELVSLFPESFAVAQLAPYPGWPVFFGRFIRDWKILKNTTGYRKISRVGVRYINRIDVPISGEVVEHEDYLYVYPMLPAVLGPVTAYGLQAQLPIADLGCKLTINSSSVPSPLLGHMSFLLDIDTARDEDAPQNDEGVCELLNQIRDKKNQIFEACISDRARELFQR